MRIESNQSCGGCEGTALHESEHCRDGIGRRTFLAQSAMLAASAVLAACAVTDATSTAPTTVSSTSLTLSDYPALSSVGGIALVSISGNPIALVRTGSASFVALSRICPHQGSVVNANGSGFLCPNHGARFDANGTWVGGQRTSSMFSYPATFDAAAGTVKIG